MHRSFIFTPLSLALALGCGVVSDRPGFRDAAPLDGALVSDAGPAFSDAGPTPSDAGTLQDSGPRLDGGVAVDAGAPEPQAVGLALTVHLEGWALDNPVQFARYVGLIRERASTLEAHGAMATWESANLQPAIEAYGDNILLELVERGHAVGVHADLGGRPDPSYTTQDMTDDLRALFETNERLDVPTTQVSGICSHLDWVTAARSAGFESTSGTVEYCLMSLPAARVPAGVGPCPNASACHDPWPNDTADQLHGWAMASGEDWIDPAPEGLVNVPTSGALPCLAGVVPGSGCELGADDIDVYLERLDVAVEAAQRGETVGFQIVWSFGNPLDAQLFEQWLVAVDAYVDAGLARWTTVVELAQTAAD